MRTGVVVLQFEYDETKEVHPARWNYENLLNIGMSNELKSIQVLASDDEGE